VQRVEGWSVAGGYRAASGEALTVDELGLGLRKLFGTAPTGLGG
jgi:hypothetical protein